MAATNTPDRKLTLLLGGRLIPLAFEEVDQALEAIINQDLAHRKPALLRCCFMENVNWVTPLTQEETCAPDEALV